MQKWKNLAPESQSQEKPNTGQENSFFLVNFLFWNNFILSEKLQKVQKVPIENFIFLETSCILENFTAASITLNKIP